MIALTDETPSATWLVRAEGVNFDATLFDTEDLSITRGASLALLAIDGLVADLIRQVTGADPECLFSGASQCLFRVSAPAGLTDLGAQLDTALGAIRSALRKPDEGRRTYAEPFEHLCIVVDANRVTSAGLPKQGDRDLTALESANRTRQMQAWSLPAPGRFAEGNRLDPFDRLRPGTVAIEVPRDKVQGDGALIRPEQGVKADKLFVSPASRDRRAFGRNQKVGFYTRELEAGDQPLGSRVTVTDSLSEIGGTPFPAPQGGEALPVSLQDKIAVIYADGNSFGALRSKVDIATFSRELKSLRRSFLRRLLAFYGEGAFSSALQDAFCITARLKPHLRDEQADYALRLEALLWGGDEFAFAVPAWLAVPVVSLFLQEARDWSIRIDAQTSAPLTHALGVVIANSKTPIRLLRARAKDIADRSKEAGFRRENSVVFEIFESVAPPDLSITRTRQQLFGLDPTATTADADLVKLDRQLALPGEHFAELVRRLEQLKAGDGKTPPFPRSQLYGALRKAHAHGDLTSSAADNAVAAHLDEYLTNFGGSRGLEGGLLTLPTLEGADRSACINLILVTQLWDYVGHGFDADRIPAATEASA